MRTVTLTSVECNKLTDVDIVGQRFSCEMVVLMAFVGGNDDPQLRDANDGFPIDENGKPTFRPSAKWYINQLDFNNQLDYNILDKFVKTQGDDLLLTIRFRGTFSEQMELQNFPCDVQELTVSMAFNCRKTGMMPLELVKSPSLTTGIVDGGFVDDKMWHLNENIACTCGYVGATEDRLFPTVDLKLFIGRQPDFVLINIALPVTFFVPMAALMFCVPRQVLDGRLSVTLAIVITSIAHKFTMSTMVPAVSYLTFLDKYVLASLAIIMLITFQSGLIGSLESFYCRLQVTSKLVNMTELTLAAVPSDIRGPVHADGLRQVVYVYDDPYCPAGISLGPFHLFDWVDACCLWVDLGLWVALQLWAFCKYHRMRSQAATAIEKMVQGDMAVVGINVAQWGRATRELTSLVGQRMSQGLEAGREELSKASSSLTQLRSRGASAKQAASSVQAGSMQQVSVTAEQEPNRM